MVHISHLIIPKGGIFVANASRFIKPEVRNQMGGLHQLFTGPEGGGVWCCCGVVFFLGDWMFFFFW